MTNRQKATLGDVIECVVTLTRDTFGEPPLANRDVTIFAGGLDRDVDPTDGEGEIRTTLRPSIAGTFHIRVDFAGDDTYGPTTAWAEVEVAEKTVKDDTSLLISMLPPIAAPNHVSVVTARLERDQIGDRDIASQKIEFFAGGTSIGSAYTNDRGEATVDYKPTATGLVKLKAIFSGDSSHKECTATRVVSVEKMETDFEIEPGSSPTKGQELLIEVKLVEAVIGRSGIAGSTVKLEVDGVSKDSAQTKTDGTATLRYTPTTQGQNKLIISYGGSGTYEGVAEQESVTVAGKTATILRIDHSVTEARPGDSVLFTIYLCKLLDKRPPLGGRKLSVLVDGKTVDTLTTDDVGEAEYTLKPTAEGTPKLEVRFAGDDLYKDTKDSTTLEVAKGTAHLSVNAPGANPYALDTVTLKAHLRDTTSTGDGIADETVDLLIDGKTLSSDTDDDGVAIFTWKPSSYGTFPAKCTFDGNMVFESAAVSTSLTADRIPTTSKLVLSSTTVKPGDEVTGTLTVTRSDTGAVIAGLEADVKLDGTDWGTLETGTDGTDTFTYTPSTEGTDAFVAQVGQTNVYASSTASASLSVKKGTLSITLLASKLNARVGEKITLSGKVTDDESGAGLPSQALVLDIGGTPVDISTSSDGTHTTTWVPLKAGTYVIKATHKGSSAYEGYDATVTVTVRRTETALEVALSDSTPYPTQVVTVTVTLETEDGDPLADASVALTIGSQSTTVTTNAQGKAPFSWIATTEGDYVVKASYAQNDTYGGSTDEVSATVAKIATAVTLDTGKTAFKVREKIYAKGTLTEKTSGDPIPSTTMTLYFGNESVPVTTDTDGRYAVEWSPLKAGTYEVKTAYGGNVKYEKTDAFTTVKALKRATRLISTITPSPIHPLDTVTASLLLEETDETPVSGASLTAKVGATTWPLKTRADGTVSFTWTATVAGSYPFSVTYAGDDTYVGKSVTDSLEVEKIQTAITLTPDKTKAKVRENVTVTAKLTNAETGTPLSGKTVVFTYPGGTIEGKTDVGGEAPLIWPPLAAGTHALSVSYAGDVKHDSASDSVSVQAVLRLTTTSLVATPSSLAPTQTSAMKAVVKETDGTVVKGIKVTFTIDSKSYAGYTDESGIATLDWKAGSEGSYSASASVVTDATYHGSSDSENITVARIDTELLISANKTSVYVSDTVQVLLTLREKSSKKAIPNRKITIHLGSYSYDQATNAQGQIPIAWAPTSAGTHKLWAEFKGDVVYEPCKTPDYYITANRIKPKLTLSFSQTSLNAGNSTIVYVKVTRSDTSAVLSSVPVILTLEGTEYPIKTNNSGIAQKTWTPTSAGTLSVKAEVKKSDKYEAVSTTGSVTVKKGSTSITTYVDKTSVNYKDQVYHYAVLRDSNGNLLANKKVSLWMGSEELELTTTATGKVSATWAAMPTGTVEFKAEFKGDSSYTSSKDSKYVTVK